MPKTKIVVTRNIPAGAQRLLDERTNDLDVVQWQSDKVRNIQYEDSAVNNCVSAALRTIVAPEQCGRSSRTPGDGLRQD